jgi:Polyketide cyclase / dehydrase and lipid transport
MASIYKEIRIEAPAGNVWMALRDFGAVHERLVPGFLVDGHLEDDGSRVVTFFNGMVLREMPVGIDDTAHRLSYFVVEGPLESTHHNASAQVFQEGNGCSRFVWITDVLPDELAPPIDELMEHGINVIKQTLESQQAPWASQR